MLAKNDPNMRTSHNKKTAFKAVLLKKSEAIPKANLE
jgi:hypothetical protein